jgi:hypothetical protein
MPSLLIYLPKARQQESIEHSPHIGFVLPKSSDAFSEQKSGLPKAAYRPQIYRCWIVIRLG